MLFRSCIPPLFHGWWSRVWVSLTPLIQAELPPSRPCDNGSRWGHAAFPWAQEVRRDRRGQSQSWAGALGRGLVHRDLGRLCHGAAPSPASEEAGGLRQNPGVSPHVAAPAGRVNLRRRLREEGRGLRSSVPTHPPPRHAPAPRGSPRPSRARLIPASTATRSLCPPMSGPACSQQGQLQLTWVVGLVATAGGGPEGDKCWLQLGRGLCTVLPWGGSSGPSPS